MSDTNKDADNKVDDDAEAEIGSAQRFNELAERHFPLVGAALSPERREPVAVDVTMRGDDDELLEYTGPLRDDDVRVLRVYNRCYGRSVTVHDGRLDLFSAFVHVPPDASPDQFAALFPYGQLDFLPEFGGYAAELKRAIPLTIDRRTMAIFKGATCVPMQVRALRVGDPLVSSPESGTFALEFMTLRVKVRAYGKPSRTTGERKKRVTFHIERDADAVTRAFTKLRTALVRLQACDRRVCELAARPVDDNIADAAEIAAALAEPSEIVETIFGPQPFVDANNIKDESRLTADDYVYTLADANDDASSQNDDDDESSSNDDDNGVSSNDNGASNNDDDQKSDGDDDAKKEASIDD